MYVVEDSELGKNTFEIKINPVLLMYTFGVISSLLSESDMVTVIKF